MRHGIEFGGFKNITVSNCVFNSCHGFALESVDGAIIEDISVTNITMRNTISAPIFIRLGSRMRGPEGVPVGVIRRVNISNIIASSSSVKYAAIISGIPGHDIEDIKLSNILMHFEGGGTAMDAEVGMPEYETKYPEPTMFGNTPSYGLYARHVKNIEMTNIEVRTQLADMRPAIILKDVTGADCIHVKAQTSPNVPRFSLENVENFNIYQSLADCGRASGQGRSQEFVESEQIFKAVGARKGNFPMVKRYFAVLFVAVMIVVAGVTAQKATGNRITVVPNEAQRRVDISIDGKPFTSYIYPEDMEKPTLYPLRAATGTLVTRGFPRDPRAGERVDHPHHVGLWFNYGNVNNLDFWNNSYAIKPEDKHKMGTVYHRAIVSATERSERRHA